MFAFTVVSISVWFLLEFLSASNTLAWVWCLPGYAHWYSYVWALLQVVLSWPPTGSSLPISLK